MIKKGKEPTVKINVEPCSILYEGDIIDCTITGEPTHRRWWINDFPKHIFTNDTPVIFDPDPTPKDDFYVILNVEVENKYGTASDSVVVQIKRLFFGDIHWHSTLCDGTFEINEIEDEFTPDDIEQWDSIVHMDLCAKFEEEFEISLEVEDIAEMETIGKMKEILRQYDVEL